MKVDIWQEKVIIPTYHTGVPDKNPMFFEKRIYQGSSGTVYPNPVIEKISDEKVDHEYIGLFLENKYLKIMILPELGGRVQMAYDKIKQRHFIYYNQVIKPALVGLCGPWISGGIEFNWPQHHRPSTFEPIDYTLVENADGSKTVWVNEVEKMFHTKGMAGFTLHPDKAYLEIKAQLYNRTNLPQTFLWWANPALKVNDDYQSIFPPDVNAVFDHGKRDVSTFPMATGTYYKVDYSPGTDISRYKNIPVPTSYMAINSKYDFVGGYEHDTHAGILHVADHHVSPGKKQWTWGHGDFGAAWDRNLTDEDGPYIELMTGVFTDNQPDFSWLMPNEQKSFTQYFLPYHEVGMVKNATKDVLVGLETAGNKITVKVFTTSLQNDLQINLLNAGQLLFSEHVNISPEDLFEKRIELHDAVDENELCLIINDQSGRELLRYEPAANIINDVPEPAKPALQPNEVENTEQLFLTGQHLEQYRHATYNPVPYYEEALKRDPKDIRNNNALGLWYLRRGQFKKSEPYFRKAIASLTQRNPNPYDSEAFYNLGLSLNYQGRVNEAYDAFFKATWSSAWQDSAYFSIAQIHVSRSDYGAALEHINWSLDKNARNSRAYLVKCYVLRKLGRIEEAMIVAQDALTRDRFNISIYFELYFCYKAINQKQQAEDSITRLLTLSRGDAHTHIEYAIEYAAIGGFEQAIELLKYAEKENGNDPLLKYYISYYLYLGGNKGPANDYLQKAAVCSPDYCFPNRLEDLIILQHAHALNPKDAYVLYYLGNLWYDKRQYSDAIACWEQSARLNDRFATVFRNLATAAYNKLDDPDKALQYLEQGYQLDQHDARVLMELDQLYKRLNYPIEVRLAFILSHQQVADSRDDMYLEKAAIYNFMGEFEKAYQLIMDRKFHPWEGGEGKVSGQYTYSLVELAKQEIKDQLFNNALEKLEQARIYPHNLGEGKLLGVQENDIFYWMGCAYEGLNEYANAEACFKKATIGLSEPSAAMFYNDQQPDKIFYHGLAWEKLGENLLAKEIFDNLVNYGNIHQDDDVLIDYFAVSLPDLLIFEDDLKKRNHIHCKYIAGLGHLGLRQFKAAEDAFKEVLAADAMHFGAKSHWELLIGMETKKAKTNIS
jgi:tetratricopeptide (TPR) repeat protein